MAEDYEGRNVKLVFIEQTDLNTKPVAGPGFVLAFTQQDISPNDGFTDFEEIDGLSRPTKPMGVTLSPNGSVDIPFHFDSAFWPLKFGVGRHSTAVDTPVVSSYTHTFNLGNVLAESPGFAIEKQQLDAATLQGRLIWGGRVNTFGFEVALTSAVIFNLGIEFLEMDAWSASLVVASPTEYTSLPIDSLTQILKVNGSPSVEVDTFNGQIDWRLETDRFPVGAGGVRHSLTRLKPMFSGSVSFFFNDDTHALITASETKAVQSFEILTEGADPNTESLSFQIANAELAQTGEPVDTSGGQLVPFDWKCYADCLTVELVNTTA